LGWDGSPSPPDHQNKTRNGSPEPYVRRAGPETI
jgi:hypothetical protein